MRRLPRALRQVSRYAVGLPRLPPEGRQAQREARHRVRQLPRRKQLEADSLRPQQDQVPAEKRPRRRHLRVLPQDAGLQGDGSCLRLVPSEGRPEERAPGQVRSQVRDLPHRHSVEDDEVQPCARCAVRAQGQAPARAVRVLPYGHAVPGEDADGVRRLSQERRRQEGTPGPLRGQVRELPRREIVDGHDFRSRAGDALRAARQARADHLRQLPRRLHLQGEAGDGLPFLSPQGRQAQRAARAPVRVVSQRGELAEGTNRPRSHPLSAPGQARRSEVRELPHDSAVQGREARLLLVSP